MPLVAGVDSSTQSTKVVLVDLDTGAALSSASAPHKHGLPPVSEQDPQMWWRALQGAWYEALERVGAKGSDVAAISVAAQCHGLVALDSQQQVIRPAKLWNDTTSAPEMNYLKELLAPREWAERTGSVPTAAFTVSKLLWLKNHEPENFDRMVKVLLPHDWLTYQLTGEMVTDRSEASGTGYYNSRTGEYDHDILSLIDPERDWSTFAPRVLGPEESAGSVSVSAQEILGLRPGTLVGAGAGDQHASALGVGAQPGDCVISLGTSGVLYATSKDSVHDELGMVDGVADAAGGYLPLVSTLNAAKVTDVFGRLLAVDHQELSRLALAAEPEGVPVLAAFLDGERKPNLPDATGTLTGLRSDVTREQIARAAVEGVVFGLRQGSDHLDRVGVPAASRVIVTGGAARSEAYRQFIADAFDATVYTSASRESVASGAAMQAAAVVLGKSVESVRDEWSPEITVAAQPKDVSASQSTYERYQAVAAWRGSDRKS